MRVAVISDTHARPGDVAAVIERVGPYLHDVDRILHAGDVTSREVLDALSRFAPIAAVAGNMDGPGLRENLPEQRILPLAGFKIGLCHGGGSPGRLPERVLRRFRDPRTGRSLVDIIVFGHSHAPLVERREGVLLVNPGSPTDRRWAPEHTMAILELGETASARVVSLGP